MTADDLLPNRTYRDAEGTKLVFLRGQGDYAAVFNPRIAREEHMPMMQFLEWTAEAELMPVLLS
ncbi:MAG TPA: hypothetical protein VF655_09970 [Allosphingosinicella sp.]|jgi:hypothetical protein